MVRNLPSGYASGRKATKKAIRTRMALVARELTFRSCKLRHIGEHPFLATPPWGSRPRLAAGLYGPAFLMLRKFIAKDRAGCKPTAS